MEPVSAALRPVHLHALLTEYDSTRALRAGQVASDKIVFDFHQSRTVYENFRPLIGEGKFDVSELAIVSFLQAFAVGTDLCLLPFVMNARLQHDTLVFDLDRKIGPGDLRGKRIAVRAYAQTTVSWVRGILQSDYGIAPEECDWIAQGPGHVDAVGDPAWVRRAPSGLSLTELLLLGHADAAVIAPKMQTDPRLVPVIGDVQSVASAWFNRTKIMPINHMLVVRRRLIDAQPDLVRETYRLLCASRDKAENRSPNLVRYGFEPLTPSVQTIADFAYSSGLLPRALSAADLFADARRVLGH